MDFNHNAPKEQTYVPTQDVIETLPDGRTLQIGVAGHAMPLSEAVRLGVADEQGNPVAKAGAADKAAGNEAPAKGPSETKPAAGPSEKK